MEVIMTMETNYQIVTRSIEQAWKYCYSTLAICLRSEIAAQGYALSFVDLS
jgi:hypothetical protein